jgi:glutathione S-transferase
MRSAAPIWARGNTRRSHDHDPRRPAIGSYPQGNHHRDPQEDRIQVRGRDSGRARQSAGQLEYAEPDGHDSRSAGRRNVVHPLFHQTIVGPNINKVPTDKAVVDNVLKNMQPKILGYLNCQIDGKFLVANTLTLADIAITSNFIVYQYMGFKIDAGQYPKLAKYLREIAALDAFQRALADEKPFVEQMGLDRSFLS